MKGRSWTVATALEKALRRSSTDCAAYSCEYQKGV